MVNIHKIKQTLLLTIPTFDIQQVVVLCGLFPGKMPEKVCFSPKIQSLLAGGEGVTMVTESVNPPRRHTPSLHDKQLMFDMMHNIRDIDDLLIKLQVTDDVIVSDYVIVTSLSCPVTSQG